MSEEERFQEIKRQSEEITNWLLEKVRIKNAKLSAFEINALIFRLGRIEGLAYTPEKEKE